MAFATESPLAITELLRSRNFATVPRDQQRLLESEDSWAVELGGTPYGSGQVPGDVLRTVKEAYIRRRDNDNNRPQSPPRHNGAGASTSGSVAGSDENDQEPDQRQELPHLSPEKTKSTIPSSPERLISAWSSSPNRAEGQSPSPAAEVVSQMLGSPPWNQVSNASTPKLPTPRTSDPNAPHVAPPPRPGTQLIAAPAFEFPSSYDDVEDMEIEKSPNQHNRNVNVTSHRASNSLTSSATTTNTPPCGQQEETTIPSTGRKQMEPPKTPPDEAKRTTRRMKPIIFSDDGPGAMKSTTVPATVVRMPSANVIPDHEMLDTTHFSSMMPANARELHPNSVLLNRKHLNDGARQDQGWRDVAMPTFNRGVEEDASTSSFDSPDPVDLTTAIGHQSPSFNDGHGRLSQGLQSGVDKRPVTRQLPRSVPQATTDKVKAPYEAFITVYPDYITDHSGSLWHFVMACVYVRLLEEERLLREYLYDDFIRAFSGGFIQYVHDAGPGQEPIPAIEWYNLTLGPILFNRMCVRKDNLESIFTSYPEEAARARVHLNKSTEQRDGKAGKMHSSPLKQPVSNHAIARRSNVRREQQAPTPPEIQPPGVLVQNTPPRLRPRAASVDLGSDAIQPEPEPEPEPVQQQPIQPPPSSASFHTRLQKKSSWTIPSSATPSSSARSENKVRKRSAAEQERLREHFRKRRSAGSVFSSSGRG